MSSISDLRCTAEASYRGLAWLCLAPFLSLLATATATLIVAESNNPIEVAEPWEMVRERSYGSTVVTIVSGPEFGS